MAPYKMQTDQLVEHTMAIDTPVENRDVPHLDDAMVDIEMADAVDNDHTHTNEPQKAINLNNTSGALKLRVPAFSQSELEGMFNAYKADFGDKEFTVPGFDNKPGEEGDQDESETNYTCVETVFSGNDEQSQGSSFATSASGTFNFEMTAEAKGLSEKAFGKQRVPTIHEATFVPEQVTTGIGFQFDVGDAGQGIRDRMLLHPVQSTRAVEENMETELARLSQLATRVEEEPEIADSENESHPVFGGKRPPSTAFDVVGEEDEEPGSQDEELKSQDEELESQDEELATQDEGSNFEQDSESSEVEDIQSDDQESSYSEEGSNNDETNDEPDVAEDQHPTVAFKGLLSQRPIYSDKRPPTIAALPAAEEHEPAPAHDNSELENNEDTVEHPTVGFKFPRKTVSEKLPCPLFNEDEQQSEAESEIEYTIETAFEASEVWTSRIEELLRERAYQQNSVRAEAIEKTIKTLRRNRRDALLSVDLLVDEEVGNREDTWDRVREINVRTKEIWLKSERGREKDEDLLYRTYDQIDDLITERQEILEAIGQKDCGLWLHGFIPAVRRRATKTVMHTPAPPMHDETPEAEIIEVAVVDPPAAEPAVVEAAPVQPIVVETPAVNTTPTEPHVVETPVVKAAPAQPLVVETPVVDTPVVDTAPVEPPLVEAPAVDNAPTEPVVVPTPILEHAVIETAVTEPVITQDKAIYEDVPEIMDMDEDVDSIFGGDVTDTVGMDETFGSLFGDDALETMDVDEDLNSLFGNDNNGEGNNDITMAEPESTEQPLVQESRDTVHAAVVSDEVEMTCDNNTVSTADHQEERMDICFSPEQPITNAEAYANVAPTPPAAAPVGPRWYNPTIIEPCANDMGTYPFTTEGRSMPEKSMSAVVEQQQQQEDIVASDAPAAQDDYEQRLREFEELYVEDHNGWLGPEDPNRLQVGDMSREEVVLLMEECAHDWAANDGPNFAVVGEVANQFVDAEFEMAGVVVNGPVEQQVNVVNAPAEQQVSARAPVIPMEPVQQSSASPTVTVEGPYHQQIPCEAALEKLDDDNCDNFVDLTFEDEPAPPEEDEFAAHNALGEKMRQEDATLDVPVIAAEQKRELAQENQTGAQMDATAEHRQGQHSDQQQIQLPFGFEAHYPQQSSTAPELHNQQSVPPVAPVAPMMAAPATPQPHAQNATAPQSPIIIVTNNQQPHPQQQQQEPQLEQIFVEVPLGGLPERAAQRALRQKASSDGQAVTLATMPHMNPSSFTAYNQKFGEGLEGTPNLVASPGYYNRSWDLANKKPVETLPVHPNQVDRLSQQAETFRIQQQRASEHFQKQFEIAEATKAALEQARVVEGERGVQAYQPAQASHSGQYGNAQENQAFRSIEQDQLVTMSPSSQIMHIHSVWKGTRPEAGSDMLVAPPALTAPAAPMPPATPSIPGPPAALNSLATPGPETPGQKASKKGVKRGSYRKTPKTGPQAPISSDSNSSPTKRGGGRRCRLDKDLREPRRHFAKTLPSAPGYTQAPAKTPKKQQAKGRGKKSAAVNTPASFTGGNDSPYQGQHETSVQYEPDPNAALGLNVSAETYVANSMQKAAASRARGASNAMENMHSQECDQPAEVISRAAAPTPSPYGAIQPQAHTSQQGNPHAAQDHSYTREQAEVTLRDQHMPINNGARTSVVAMQPAAQFTQGIDGMRIPPAVHTGAPQQGIPHDHKRKVSERQQLSSGRSKRQNTGDIELTAQQPQSMDQFPAAMRSASPQSMIAQSQKRKPSEPQQLGPERAKRQNTGVAQTPSQQMVQPAATHQQSPVHQDQMPQPVMQPNVEMSQSSEAVIEGEIEQLEQANMMFQSEIQDNNQKMRRMRQNGLSHVPVYQGLMQQNASFKNQIAQNDERMEELHGMLDGSSNVGKPTPQMGHQMHTGNTRSLRARSQGVPTPRPVSLYQSQESNNGDLVPANQIDNRNISSHSPSGFGDGPYTGHGGMN